MSDLVIDRSLLGQTADGRNSPAFNAELAARRSRLAGGESAHVRRMREFPILAVVAPVMTVRGGEVAYPGDPMCLYAALGVSIQSASESLRRGLVSGAPYNDFLPGWGAPPSVEYRRKVAAGHAGEPPDTPDRVVFDPRVWDRAARDRFSGLLATRKPTVVLISSVSSGLPHAIAIAAMIRERAPGALTVLGGRHADETIRFIEPEGAVHALPGSPLDTDGPLFDVVVAGQAPYALDGLLRAVGLALDAPTGKPRMGDVRLRLRQLAANGLDPAGRGVIVTLGPDGDAVAFPFGRRPLDGRDLPSPYRSFPIRARFTVFQTPERRTCLTAHMMTGDTCPFACSFCSEGRGVRAAATTFGDVAQTVERVAEVVHYGAEALYFDDPVFWGGRLPAMLEFAQLLAAMRDGATRGQDATPWIATAADAARLRQLQWGMQLTVDLVAGQSPARLRSMRRVLRAAAAAGCTYVYLGIESMAEEVIRGVQKNRGAGSGRSWRARVREALQEIRDAGLAAGSSVLFGLDGETAETIAQTIEEIGQLIDDELLVVASPNVLTYHPGTPIAAAHGAATLDYRSPEDNRPPYTFFEEAYPGLVSRVLDEEAIWTIHEQADRRWHGRRNWAEVEVPAMDVAS